MFQGKEIRRGSNAHQPSGVGENTFGCSHCFPWTRIHCSNDYRWEKQGEHTSADGKILGCFPLTAYWWSQRGKGMKSKDTLANRDSHLWHQPRNAHYSAFCGYLFPYTGWTDDTEHHQSFRQWGSSRFKAIRMPCVDNNDTFYERNHHFLIKFIKYSNI